MEKRQPIGIELVKKGVVKEADIEKALDYQKTHPNKKIGDILDILKLCDSDILINAMGEILDEKAIYLQEKDVRIDALEYISLDIMKQNKAIPFEIASGKIKVCYSDIMKDGFDKRNKEDRWVEKLSLQAAMDRLGKREKHIIRLRFFEGKTQMEVAEEIGISQAQVSRLEKNALRAMRQYLRSE